MSTIISFIAVVLAVAGNDIAEYNGYVCGSTGEVGPRSTPKTACLKPGE